MITSDMFVAFRSTDLHPDPDAPPTYFGIYASHTDLERDIQRRLRGPVHDEIVKITAGTDQTVAVIREREPDERLRVERFYVRPPGTYDLDVMPTFMTGRIAALAGLVQQSAQTLRTPAEVRQYSYLSDALLATSRVTTQLGWLT
ncbi:hypothetical protein [Deinococcus soli (ex Cha et al. 2016)]|uniref:Uncharacterized protein n=2 Tax=Deinococcus soli (ex Cha et al. 2016) TaxID=1309411 RepID=A0ACC6KH31_9DEIO|nr:hypothetical protein [Deinococcus soli (ex Cha et al. 2016)]MDR6219005.1 hypothetical protein [Deinococcus soli (ex Cha et al. 2016)]MDR6328802.1 hypothetical protein [Deinococcus soli (ex Cha et al. 2016)]MDR6751711.1 hypothetical protein [Deinococcus soli (ex Cha et al. 2016)]